MSEREKYIFNYICKFTNIQYYNHKNKITLLTSVDFPRHIFRSRRIPKRIYYITINHPNKIKTLRTIKVYSSFPSVKKIKTLYIPFWYKEVNSLINNLYDTYKPKSLSSKKYVSDTYTIDMERLIRDHKISNIL